ncbi:myosin heavy chain IB-like [Pollicipes pollicipes]|uniref:myosin heavy chain IB-like n=1 Tax=Pollicipes pollicipes TaxID=41117 RepID=UPI001885A0C8|nr:myosin heavy chain IB-like [Pollicipes pollicipes]
MSLHALLFVLGGLITLSSCSLGHGARDSYFDSGTPNDEFSYGFMIAHPQAGGPRRPQRHLTENGATMFGSHNRRRSDGRQAWRFFIDASELPVGDSSQSYVHRVPGDGGGSGFSGGENSFSGGGNGFSGGENSFSGGGNGFSSRQGRLGDGSLRTEVNYAAGKQPIVVKVSPRPYQPLPEVTRPLGAGPGPGQAFGGGFDQSGRPFERPFGQRPEGSFGRPQNSFNRPQNSFNRPTGAFNRPPGSFSRPPGAFNQPNTQAYQSGFGQTDRFQNRPSDGGHPGQNPFAIGCRWIAGPAAAVGAGPRSPAEQPARREAGLRGALTVRRRARRCRRR